MQTHTAQQQAIAAIEQLPDDVALDEIVYRLYVLNKVRQGLEDVDAGRVVSGEAIIDTFLAAEQNRQGPRS